jgi:hypothetical protein
MNWKIQELKLREQLKLLKLDLSEWWLEGGGGHGNRKRMASTERWG